MVTSTGTDAIETKGNTTTRQSVMNSSLFWNSSVTGAKEMNSDDENGNPIPTLLQECDYLVIDFSLFFVIVLQR